MNPERMAEVIIHTCKGETMCPFLEVGYPGKRNEDDQSIQPYIAKGENGIQAYTRAGRKIKTDRKRRLWHVRSSSS